MANYISLQKAIDAKTTNMTVLRNNVKNDDGTTTYATGIDWFKFNGVTVSNIYSSGNSWLGFGASSEQLKVNRRDCAVWYEWKETGKIGVHDFFRFRWRGYSQYSTTSASYLQEFEVFLFDTGQIYLNFFTVPTSNNDGTKQLVCGSETVGFSVTSGTACEYTFTPSDTSSGTGWAVISGKPDVDFPYKSSGNAIFTFSNYIAGGNDTLYWTAEEPTNTNILFSTSVNNGAWKSASNGGLIPDMVTRGQTCSLRIKAELSTSNTRVTPRLSEIKITADDDKKALVLTLNAPNISSAIGTATISYDGLGSLQGMGGPTAPFEENFTPTGLIWKGHQNDNEHISMLLNAALILRQVVYTSAKSSDEHLEISNLSASITLIDVHDL